MLAKHGDDATRPDALTHCPHAPSPHIKRSSAVNSTVDGLIIRREVADIGDSYGVWIKGGQLRLQACDITSAAQDCVRIQGAADPTLTACKYVHALALFRPLVFRSKIGTLASVYTLWDPTFRWGEDARCGIPRSDGGRWGAALRLPRCGMAGGSCFACGLVGLSTRVLVYWLAHCSRYLPHGLPVYPNAEGLIDFLLANPPACFSASLDSGWLALGRVAVGYVAARCQATNLPKR